MKNKTKDLDKYYQDYHTTKKWKAINSCNSYNNSDKEKGFDITNNIDSEWFIEHISNSACTFCGESDWNKLGADRIDNSKPHTPENVVCSCWNCNNARGEMSFEDFIKYKKDLE